MTEELIRVLIVDDHRELAKGVQATLGSAPGIMVVDNLDRLPDPRRPGLRFDICLLDLMGYATAEQLTEFLAVAPAVVYSVESQWQQRVAAWVCGARSVLGKDIHGGVLVDAVRDAVHRPFVLSPQLAAALSTAIDEYRLRVPEHVRQMLDELASWRDPEQALRRLGIDRQQWESDLDELRALCVNRELGRLEITDSVRDMAVSSGAVPLPQAAELTDRQRECLELRADGLTVREIQDTLGIKASTVETHLKDAMARFGIGKVDRDTTMVFALYVMGRHRHPERLRGLLERLRDGWPASSLKGQRLPL